MKTESYTNWHLEVDANNALWLGLDREDSSANTLNKPILDELDQIVKAIENDKKLTGLVIYSKKTTGFIAGADIAQFTQIEDEEQAFDFVRNVQQLYDKIEALKIPTLAMINGFCLGGGLELALACRYRIALDSPKTKIGLPEVKLGIIPGWGGSIRLPRLIGAIKAFSLILAGKVVSARAAKKLGIVDEAVPERLLLNTVKFYLAKQPEPRKANRLESLTNSFLVRPILAQTFYKKLAAKIAKQHYPAPFALIDKWRKDGVSSKNAMVSEAKLISKLLLTPTSRHLVQVFFLQEKMKALTKVSKFTGKHVHVIGAGAMGGDIAAWCALQGMRVTLQDQKIEQIAPAIKRAEKLYKKKLKKPLLIRAVMDRLIPDVAGNGIKNADIIIEAIFENLEVKQKVFVDVEKKAKRTAILATNTSSIPLDEINTKMKDPTRLVGVHFFNPVPFMPLVEIVTGKHTSQEVRNQAAGFVGRIKKSPIFVKSSPGFVVNRILMPYLMEACLMLEEGINPRLIDQSALDFGMPMGPVELADTVGLDICLSVAKELVSHFGGEIPKSLIKKVKAGELGKKTGHGFYHWEKGKVKHNDGAGSDAGDDAIQDRLILMMLNESVACLREKVIDSADSLDAGMIFGTGFAPFRGGPICYAKQRGVDQIVKRLSILSSQYSTRFKPDKGWLKLKE